MKTNSPGLFSGIPIYVDHRRELTSFIDYSMSDNCEFYRVCIHCNCPEPHNRRDGLLVIDNGIVLARVVRCKACRKGGRV